MIRARAFDSGWRRGTGNYNGIGTCSGVLYYALCSSSVGHAAAIFRLDPVDGSVRLLASLDAAGDGPAGARVPHGKVHAPLFEYRGRLIVTTHVSHYRLDGTGRELPGDVPEGTRPYSGGLVLSLDPAGGAIEALAVVPPGEGIVAAAIDPPRDRLFLHTWPTGRFLALDLRGWTLADLGCHSGGGELGSGPTFHKLCRAVVVCPDDGSAWFTNSTGALFRWSPEEGRVACVSPDALRRDVFGHLDPHGHDTLGYQWRQAVWSAADRLVYAVHGRSQVLFTIDPRTGRVEVLERLASDPVRRSGRLCHDDGSLGLCFAPGGRTLCYFANGDDEKHLALGVAGVAEPVVQPWPANHFVTWDTVSRRYRDHGRVVLEDGRTPRHCNAMAIDEGGTVYTVPFIEEPDGIRSDLVSFPLPPEVRL